MTRAKIRVQDLPIAELVIGHDFRLDEDPDDLAQLAASIAEHGVLQALTVRPLSTGWEVGAGRRRLAAARMAGRDTVPCQIRELTDVEADDIALTENLHRRNLSAIEEGLAYARLRDAGLKQTEIAQRVGRAQSHVSMLLRVLELPAEMRDRIHRRELSYVTALDLWGRKRFREEGAREGGTPSRGALTGSDSELVSHWRRRHDRLLGGLHAILKDLRVGTHHSPMMMLDRLIKLDREPFPDAVQRERRGS